MVYFGIGIGDGVAWNGIMDGVYLGAFDFRATYGL